MSPSIYTGTMRSFDDVIKAHLQIPSHLRAVSVVVPNDSEISTFTINVLYEGYQTVLKHFDLRDAGQGHELDIDLLESADESGSDDAGVDSRGLELDIDLLETADEPGSDDVRVDSRDL